MRSRFALSEWKKKKLPHATFWILLALICGVFQTLALGAAPPPPSLAWKVFAIASHFTSSFLYFAIFLLAALFSWETQSKSLYRVVVSSAFLYLVLIVANTLLYSTMGFHLNVATSMLFTGRWTDFVNTLEATQIPTPTLFKIVAAVIVSAPITRGLHHACALVDERFLKNPPGLFQILFAWIICLTGTIAYQSLAASHLPTESYLKEIQASAFTPRIFKSPESPIRFKIKMKEYQRQDQYPVAVAVTNSESTPSVGKNQNIFYFVAETLRGDFVTPEIMPNLFSFKNREISFSVTRSNSNATHVSWDAIYLSSLPLYWGRTHTQPSSQGSIPIREFKRVGFKIHVFTKEMDSHFWDAKKIFYGTPPIYDSHFEGDESLPTGTDRQSLEALKKTLTRNQGAGKNLYIINLDSAHHDYFWPTDFPAKFLPYADLTSNLNWKYSPEIAEQIKNKYLNSLFYVDYLLGDFFQFLEKENRYTDSTIAIVGDHGEEFLENGFFAHGGSLYNPQINAGIFLKIPGIDRKRLSNVISQVDVFPTLLDAMGAYRKEAFQFLEGQSVLNQKSPDDHFVVSFSSEGAMTPYRGALCNSFGKLLFELNKKDPLHSDELIVTELLDNADRPLVDVHSDADNAKVLIQKHFLKNLKEMRFLEELSEI